MRALIDRLRRDPGLLALLVAIALVVLLYAPTLGRGLVDYDDTYLIHDNWIVQTPSWSTLHTIFFDLDSPRRFTLSPEYLPVRDLSIMLDCAIFGDWYPGFHAMNLAIYLGAIVAWFGVFVGFGIDRRIAGIAILVWAIHPSHAESVAWLAERKGVLAALFTGLAGVGYARFRAGRRPAWLGLALVAAVAGVWSKAPAAFAIAAFAGLELALPALRVSRRRVVLGLGALAVVAAAAFVPVLLLATGSDVVGTATNAPAGRIAMVFGVHGFYLELAGMVVSNSISYPISLLGPSTAELAVGALGLVAALAAVFVPRSPPVLRAAGALWLVNWLPISHLILPLRMIVVADRYLLLPSLGLALAIGVGITAIPVIRGRRALLGVVVFAAALRTFDAQSNWRDGATLWERGVRSNPTDGIAWSAYADALTKAGDPARAVEVASRGLQLSRDPRLLLRKALLLLENGNRKGGLRAMRDAAVAGEPRAMSNLGLLLLEDRQLDEALAWARRGAAAMPMYAPASRALGRIALAADHPQEAFVAFLQAYELEPASCLNRYNLALAQIQLQRIADARVHLDACLDDPAVAQRVRAELEQLGKVP